MLIPLKRALDNHPLPVKKVRQVVLVEQEVVVAVTKKTSILSRLSCVALTLPGIAIESQAARLDEEIHTDFQIGHYAESDDRMSVDIYEASLSTPIGERMTFNLGYIRDVVSGASPIFNLKDANNNPKQILSSASIREERNVVDAGAKYYFDNYDISLSAGLSDENDYLSKYMKSGVSWDFNNKMTTLFSSFSLAWNKIDPTDKDFSDTSKSQELSMGLTQILTEKSLFSSNLSYSNKQGYLSDPYKYVFFSSSGIRSDKRPENRGQWAWLNRYIQSFNQFNDAALHLDYRYYHDNWDIDAHTFEASWHQPLSNSWELVPRVRYYTQKSADFYKPYFNSIKDQNYYSSDYRLADFGAVSFGLHLTKELYRTSSTSKFNFKAGVDYYSRKASYKLGSGDNDNFADYDSYLISASIKYTF
jgi:hypothetical protein